MKNILLLVHDDAGQEARLQAALDIGRALEGHLTCLDVTQVPILADDYYDGGATGILLEAERERESRNREKIEARLAHEDLPWNWIDITGDMAECVSSAAGLADLIVTNRRLDQFPEPDMLGITGQIAVKTGKPVVAVPDDCPRFDATGRALIAWDGSAPVMSAMRACVPLLALAGAVEIFTVDDGSESTSAEDAATYLSRHNIHAEIRRVPGDTSAADLSIIEECVAWRASYCLMGAFSHSRLTETLFGGVTRRMLKTSLLPLVLGH